MAEDRKARIDGVLNKLLGFIESKNIAADLDATELAQIGTDVCNDFDIDLRSRAEWEEGAEKAMEVALQVRKAKNWPFERASNVKWPLVTVAALQFNARAYPAIVNDDDIVSVKVVGADPDGAKRAKADRISEHMSYQLSEQMEEWEEDTDTLLMQLPIVGCAFRKVYYDDVLGRNRSEMIPAIDLVVNQGVRTLEEAPRVTHRLRFYPQQVKERQRAKLWLDEDFGIAPTGDGDKDAPHEFLEQHRFLDLDGDDYAEPYIVTVHKQSSKVVRIVANYGQDDVKWEGSTVLHIAKQEYFVKYGFIPDPAGGFYDIGFGRLLESIGAAVDSAINQMLDAGTLQNAGGGFIGSGVRLKKSHVRMEPGVYKTIDASGGKLREAIYNFEHPGPSVVLFQLVDLMLAAAKDITSVKDILTGDTGDRTQTATTTLALIEQGMKVFTAIYKRIYKALRREFGLIYRLNAENLPEQDYFTVLDTEKAVARSDYQIGAYDVCPSADPRVVTDMQKAARANVLMQFINDPLVNQMEIRKRVFLATGQDEIESLLVTEPPQPDPLVVAQAEADVAKTQAEVEKTQADTMKTVVDTKAAASGIEHDAAKIMQDESRLDMEAAKIGQSDREAMRDSAERDADRRMKAKEAA